MDVEEAAAYLRISVRSLQRLVEQKKIGSFKVPGCRLFAPRHLHDYLISVEVPAQEPSVIQQTPSLGGLASDGVRPARPRQIPAPRRRTPR